MQQTVVWLSVFLGHTLPLNHTFPTLIEIAVVEDVSLHYFDWASWTRNLECTATSHNAHPVAF
ncbi:hypothetical protein CHR55_15225 [Rhodococcus qingshengii]|uniref:Uncharacterized protein n=1 Tax=Rhodococcus qingshengii TaxID=334542 RepID=A0A2A5JAG1_RHOSG|nr:hypothetical protein CHR55_15225 [Rhodococcus qingshengii]